MEGKKGAGVGWDEAFKNAELAAVMLSIILALRVFQIKNVIAS